jgi:predicted HicB family RNase H-like nuclease
MKDLLSYKGMYGSVHFSAADSVFYGKLEMIGDLVTFEGKNVDELKKAFVDAVEDYLTICRQTEKDPLKPFKGSFNVRIPPQVHQETYEAALRLGMSLNQYVQKAIEDENKVVTQKSRTRKRMGLKTVAP